MSYETLVIERDGRVATLTMNRPDSMNAFDSRMRAELPQAWEELAEDESVWVIVLTGAGDRAFSAGMDLREKLDPGSLKKEGRTQITSIDCAVGKPVVAAVNGVCAGGGLAFVADSDIVICSDNAYFTDARTGAGQVSIHGTLRLARKIPLEAVLRMVMLGRAEKVGAERARAIGLVSEITTADVLLTRAKEIAAAIAENSPGAVFTTRHAIWESLNYGLNGALEMGWQAVTDFAHSSGDAAEGARAFVEKRKPKWEYAPPPGRGKG
ncbi:MAG: enoyl-CoA hydratase-related protein [Deltaproteobacteria bacterium]